MSDRDNCIFNYFLLHDVHVLWLWYVPVVTLVKRNKMNNQV